MAATNARFPYTLSAKTLTVLIDGNPYQTDRSNPNWTRIVALLSDPKATADALLRLIQPIQGLADIVLTNNKTKQQVTIKAGAVFWGNESVHNALTKRILDIVQEGLPVDPWLRFMENVYQNPFPAAKVELFEFLEKCNLPITADGCFIAHKLVTSDYKDIYTKQIDNSVGKVVEMDRSKVDGDRRNLCSTGLHFCSQEYLPHYGNSAGTRTLLVKINPADVVSIPLDYNKAKGRCARYQVVGETTRENATKAQWRPVVHDKDWDNPNSDDTVTTVDTPDFWAVFTADATDLSKRVELVSASLPGTVDVSRVRKFRGEYEALDMALLDATDKKAAKDARALLNRIASALERLDLAANNPLPQVERDVEALHNMLVSEYQHSTDQQVLNKKGVEAHGKIDRLKERFDEARKNPLNTEQDLERVAAKMAKTIKFLLTMIFDIPTETKDVKINTKPLKPKAPAKKAAPAKAAPTTVKPTVKVDNRPGFETKIGRLTKTRWNALLKEHGSLAAIARHYNVSQGTLQGYKKRLFG